MVHPIECAAGQLVLSELYVRDGPAAIGDKRMYDMGEFTIATGGQQTDGILGELWCTYEVEFYQAKMGDEAASFLWTKYLGNGSGAGNPFNNPVYSGGFQLFQQGPTDMAFPEDITSGTFLAVYYQTQAANAVSGTSYTPIAANTMCQVIYLGNAPGNGATSNTYILYFAIKVLAAGAQFRLGSGTVPYTAWSLNITQVNPEMYTFPVILTAKQLRLKMKEKLMEQLRLQIAAEQSKQEEDSYSETEVDEESEDDVIKEKEKEMVEAYLTRRGLTTTKR